MNLNTIFETLIGTPNSYGNANYRVAMDELNERLKNDKKQIMDMRDFVNRWSHYKKLSLSSREVLAIMDGINTADDYLNTAIKYKSSIVLTIVVTDRPKDTLPDMVKMFKKHYAGYTRSVVEWFKQWEART
jgi:hypothetical protein